MSRRSFFTNDERLLLELLTTTADVVILFNMKAELLIDERHVLDTQAFVEIVVGVCRGRHEARPTGSSIDWRSSSIVSACCAMTTRRARATTGVLDAEKHCDFTDPDALLADFWREVEEWRR